MAATTLAGTVAALSLATASLAAVRGIQVDPQSGPPLTDIKIIGSGFCASGCSRVSILITSLYVATDVPVSASGRISAIVRVPGTVRPGPTQVVARQLDGQGNTQSAYATFTVTVSQPAATSYKPTGSPPPPGGLPPPSQGTARPTPGPTLSVTPKAVGSVAATPGLRDPSPTASPAASPAAAQPSRTPSAGISWWLVLVIAAAAAGGLGLSWWAHRRRSTG